MLQSYGTHDQPLAAEPVQGLDLGRYLSILKRRRWYLLLPFLTILTFGSVLVGIQRSIYTAEGKVLVESQEIPPDLVRPTVMTAASERIQVIAQRMMTRDTLVTVMNKYGLFPSQRAWMSDTQLLDLMRDRTNIQLVDLDAKTGQNRLTIAFTVSFEYENPELAARVANEFVTLILAADARDRSNRAGETTRFLAREVTRLGQELTTAQNQVTDARRRAREEAATNSGSGGGVATTASGSPDAVATQLASLKADLLQMSAVYSKTHPNLRALQQRIAALERASPPGGAQTSDATSTATQPRSPAAALTANQIEIELEPVLRQQINIERNLEEASKKYEAARLGETMERDQRSERLQVIEQPSVPQEPTRPKKLRLYLLVLGAAMVSGAGAMVASEALDPRLHGKYELSGVIDSSLIVSIPFIATKADLRRRKLKFRLRIGAAVAAVIAAVGVFLAFGPPVDVLWARAMTFDYSSFFESISRLSDFAPKPKQTGTGLR